MADPQRRLVVGAIVVDDLAAPTRVLACRRTRPEAIAGQWEFPGGKVEPGETPAAALVREIAEELSVAIEVGAELLDATGGRWPIDERYELALLLAALAPGEVAVPGTDHDELRWLTGATLDTVDWLPADLRALPRLRALLAEDRP
ncbi:(deoxy)nucleoside triphosphate pyrophosphohydrolase [Pimelobacter simplex]|uniref:(deoxy)nucleoside triphosphate pyrophosphohydrolase n=1 Tax=Nocardioides simplex TaxID=2045 RepID=UPI003AADF432